MYKIIDKLIKSGELKTDIVIDAFNDIPRTEFVPSRFRNVANEDISIPIGSGAFMPRISAVVKAFELLSLKKGEKAVVSGHTGGWITAIMSYIVGKDGLVVTIGRSKELQEKVIPRVKEFNFIENNKLESYTFEFSERSACPMRHRIGEFDKIILIEKCLKLDALTGLLKKGGRAVVIGDKTLSVINKDEENNISTESYDCKCF